jgi:hypothetical protein
MNNTQRDALESKLIDAMEERIYAEYDVRFNLILNGRIGITELDDIDLVSLADDCYQIDVSEFVPVDDQPVIFSDTHIELLRKQGPPDAMRLALVAMVQDHLLSPAHLQNKALVKTAMAALGGTLS